MLRRLPGVFVGTLTPNDALSFAVKVSEGLLCFSFVKNMNAFYLMLPWPANASEISWSA